MSEKPSEEEILRNQTKQVLLEYFSLIPEEKQNEIDIKEFGINNTTIEETHNGELRHLSGKPAQVNIFNGSSEHCHVQCDERIVKRRTGKKYHTHVIGRDELSSLMKQIAAHTKHENGKVVVRSKSFESRKYYLAMRTKMQQLLLPIVTDKSLNHEMQLPIVLDKSVIRGIREVRDFDMVDSLQNTPTKLDNRLKDETSCIESRLSAFPNCSLSVPSCKCRRRKPEKRLSVTIPKHNVITTHGGNSANKSAVSANTYAVNLLEEISQDIMANFPNVLNEAINELLTPLQVKREIPYELFATVAKPMLTLRLKGVITNIWQNISLVMALVKETMIVGNFDDDMMEVMVDHSTKFFMENVVQSVEEEGGWDILNISDPTCEGFEDGKLAASCQHNTQCENSDRFKTLKEKDTNYNWIPVVVALLTVGLGLVYSLR